MIIGNKIRKLEFYKKQQQVLRHNFVRQHKTKHQTDIKNEKPTPNDRATDIITRFISILKMNKMNEYNNNLAAKEF